MTNPAASILAQLNAIDVSDDLYELWDAAFKKLEDLSIALDHEAEADRDDERAAMVARLSNAIMTSNQIAYHRGANQ